MTVTVTYMIIMGKPVRRTQSNLRSLSLFAKAKGNEERPNQTRHCAKLSTCGIKYGKQSILLKNDRFFKDKFFRVVPRLKGIDIVASEGLVSDGKDIILSARGIFENRNGMLRLTVALANLGGQNVIKDMEYKNTYICNKM